MNVKVMNLDDNNKAKLFRDRGDWNEALALYQQAAQAAPEQWENHVAIGDMSLNIGDWKAAISAYKKSINIKADFDWAWHNLAVAFGNLGQWEDVDRCHKKLLAINPDFFEINQGIELVSQHREAFLKWQSNRASPHPDDKQQKPQIATDDFVAQEILSLFDEDYYTHQLDDYSIEDPLSHFMNKGWRDLLSPSPLFDTKYYLSNNQDVAIAGVNPLRHYVRSGDKENRNPHPLFSVKLYRQQYRDSIQSKETSLGHFIRVGWEKKFNPSPAFLTQWYCDKYLDNKQETINPLVHYCTIGFKQNNKPNPLFDTLWYLKQNPDVRSSQINPLAHYLTSGAKQARKPSPLFFSDYYVANLKKTNIVIDDGMTPMEHYLVSGSDVSPCPLFDPVFYRQQIGDHPPSESLLAHYLETGWKSSLDPHPFFRGSFYLKKYPDIEEAGICPLVHFCVSGYQESRWPNPFFDTKFYVDNYGQYIPSGENPVVYYLRKGSKAGHRAYGEDSILAASRTKERDRKVLLSKHGGGLLPSARDSKIGVFAHIFYPDLADEVISYTNNIDFKNCKIFISTDDYTKVSSIRQQFSNSSQHPFEIRVLPNRGRDIAPMLVGFADRIRKVDYGVHIHTKRSKHYGKAFDRWRTYLYESNLGSSTIVDSIIALLSDHEIGAVFPKHFAPIDPLISWGQDFHKAAGLVNMMGHSLSEKTYLEFPSGSMFWFRSDALAPLLNLRLSLDMFDFEAGQVDGTLAHAIERIFLIVVEIAGYDWLRIQAREGRAYQSQHDLLTAIQASRQRIFPTGHVNTALVSTNPELTPFHYAASTVDKPRLVLLIPTADTGKAYAGVSTALQVFFETWRKVSLDFDACIVNCDTPIGNQYAPSHEFEITEYGDNDFSGMRSVVDASSRGSRFFQLREKDIFVATAWWTAHHALAAMVYQEKTFGVSKRKFVYLIQDYESGFYPWSSRFMYSDETYGYPQKTFPIFNTQILADFMLERFEFGKYAVLMPGMNKGILDYIQPDKEKKKKILLYYRPHAVRNCCDFLEAVVEEAIHTFPEFKEWEFIGIGEDVGSSNRYANSIIKHSGRLTLQEYGALTSESAIAISLMVSPHPSYPPLELASGGVLTITNIYAKKDLSKVHENIFSLESFSLEKAAHLLHQLAKRWESDRSIGWRGQPKQDWFYSGASNLSEMSQEVANELSAILAP